MTEMNIPQKLVQPILMAGDAIEMYRKFLWDLEEQIEDLEEERGYFEREYSQRFKVGMISELKRVLYYAEYNYLVGEFELAKGCTRDVVRRMREFNPRTELKHHSDFTSYLYDNLGKDLKEFNDFEWFALIGYAMSICNMELIRGITEYPEFRELEAYKPNDFEFLYKTTFEPFENEVSFEFISKWLAEVTFENVQEKRAKLMDWIENNEISIHYIPQLVKLIVTLNAILHEEDVEERISSTLYNYSKEEKSYQSLANRISSELEQLLPVVQ